MARPIAGIHPFGPPFRMQQGRTPRAPAYEAPVQSIKDDESSVKKLSELALDRRVQSKNARGLMKMGINEF